MTDRTELILTRFTDHFNEIGAEPQPMTRAEWEAMPLTSLRASQGFLRPDRENEGVALFCPELIAAQTEHLDDEELNVYLDAVQWIVDKETTLFEYDLELASQMAEDALADFKPGSLRLMTKVQMAWLDRSRG